uniref:Uncharacterized protein n=1 Tax=Alexandrium monilatum TaxID=311494 RepID=A0A7S4Q1R2_9DINO
MVDATSSTSSPSSFSAEGSMRSPVNCGEEGLALQVPAAARSPRASLATRPSVGTWLLPRPVECEGPGEAVFAPCDRFLMLHDPCWARWAGLLHQPCLEPRPESEREGEAERPEVSADIEAIAAHVEEYRALEQAAYALAREFAAIARSWREASAEGCELQVEISQALVKQQRLQERVVRLRKLLRQAKGLSAEEVDLDLPASPAGAKRVVSVKDAAKIFQRARLLHRLPEKISRAECFDRDEDGLGTATLETLAQEVATLAAFRDEAAREFEAEEAEVSRLRRTRSLTLEANQKLELRILHLRTSVASAKQRAAAATGSCDVLGAPKQAALSNSPEKPKASLARLRQGGC